MHGLYLKTIRHGEGGIKKQGVGPSAQLVYSFKFWVEGRSPSLEKRKLDYKP
jgi:hypothetical protein